MQAAGTKRTESWCPGMTFQYYQDTPKFKDQCDVNVTWDTLAKDWPKSVTTRGPSTLKDIYTGIPNYYPPDMIQRPIDSLYGADLSQYGPYGRRDTYGFRAYPLHHHHIKEDRMYANKFLPVPSIFGWTNYPAISSDGYIEYYRSYY